MPHTPSVPKDFVALIVTALNGTTVNGGVVKAVADGNAVRVIPHSDLPGAGNAAFEIHVS